MAKADLRRLIIYQTRVVEGELAEDYAGAAFQDMEGNVTLTGMWNSLLPLSPEDIRVQAEEAGVSSIEWLRIRLQQSALIRVEVVQ